jgi:hypothetical protein
MSLLLCAALSRSGTQQKCFRTEPGIDHKPGDFTDKNAGDDYGYGKNGNLVTDRNKKMGTTTGVDLTTGGAIQYTHLNLPAVISVKDDGANDYVCPVHRLIHSIVIRAKLQRTESKTIPLQYLWIIVQAS